MSDLPLHQQQLDFMIQLASYRTPFFDPIFRFLHYVDSPYFFFIFIPTLWIGYSYRWGIRIYYWFTFSLLLNGSVKFLLNWPRPSTDLPALGLFSLKSPGFPSGAAQTTVFLGGILIYYWRRPLAWIIGLTYILLISFSRLYLGVHYPLDILGGWLIGAVLLALFIFAGPPLERWLSSQSSRFRLLLSLCIPAFLLFLFPPIAYFMAGALGMALGIYFSLQNHLYLPPPKTLLEGIFRSLMGIGMLFLIVLLYPKSNGQAFTAALLMSLVASPLCKRMLKAEHPM